MNAEKETRISNTGNLFCFNSNVSNLYNERVVEKTNDMIFNPTKILKLIYISPIESALKKRVMKVLRVIKYISLCTNKPDIFLFI
jgi:hypothetical protein